MSICELYDKCEPQLIAEGFTKAQRNSLAEFCLISEEYKEKNPNAEHFWITYCSEDNGITLLKEIQTRFETLIK